MKPGGIIIDSFAGSGGISLNTKECRDCPDLFRPADVRSVLCDRCKKANRAANHRRQMQRWWKRQPDESRRAVYRRQWQGQKRRFNKLPPEIQGAVAMLGNLRRRVSEKQNRRSA